MATKPFKGVIDRSILPIPDQAHVGLTTYDAKDPDTKYPPSRELRPPTGAQCSGHPDGVYPTRGQS